MRPRSDTLLVWTGAPCTNGCRACPIDPATAASGLQATDLRSELLDVPGMEGRLIVLAGGEPFLRPDYPRLIAAIRALGGVPGIVTTGRPLLYPQLRERLRRSQLAYLRIQLFGVGAAHDRAVSVPGAFEQAMAGLRAWLSEADTTCDVDVALSTRGRRLEDLVHELEALEREVASSDVQLLIAIDPHDRTELLSHPALPAIRAALAKWNDDSRRPLLAWEGFPQSTLSPLSVPALSPRFVGTTPSACCLGRIDEIAHAARTREKRVCANSFNYVRTAISVPYEIDAAACTAYEAAPADESFRQLWLIEDEKLALYTTDTGDFEPSEIIRIKDEHSHLFLDCSPAGVLDDITHGMRRVLPDPTCEGCAHHAQCGRRFHVVDGAPFAREEAWISSYVSGLRGRVLDVGCGEQLYRDEIGPLIRSGAVQYTGLDPDETSLASVRAVLPEGRFQRGSIEDFRDEPASYDHILCLRSLNHVTDVDESVGRMAALLKPGGLLLMVECTAFTMLRRQEQVLAADRAPRAGHQHLHNLASDEVLPFARRHGLRLLEHHGAARQTTNEWILLFSRADASASRR